jgi:hypothetical protein
MRAFAEDAEIDAIDSEQTDDRQHVLMAQEREGEIGAGKFHGGVSQIANPSVVPLGSGVKPICPPSDCRA